MKKRILFFSCEPGGAEVLIPVIKLIDQQQDYEAVVVAFGHAMDRFKKKNVEYVKIDPIARDDFSVLDHYAPDMVITSATSLPFVDMTEKHLWIQAREQGVPSMAFLDQWQNYVQRFSGVDASEKMAYLPDYINCINMLGKNEMVSEGFDPTILVAFGHPYLSSLQHEALELDGLRLRDRIGLSSSDRVVLFVSEAIRQHYGNQRGYDQYDALNLLMEYIASSEPDSILLVKLHPKDDLDGYGNLQNAKLNTRILQDELTSLECITIADVVYGMSSIMLIEAFVLGKPVGSIQPGIHGVDAFVLTRSCRMDRIESLDGFVASYRSHSDDNDFYFDESKFLAYLDRCAFR